MLSFYCYYHYLIFASEFVKDDSDLLDLPSQRNHDWSSSWGSLVLRICRLELHHQGQYLPQVHQYVLHHSDPASTQQHRLWHLNLLLAAKSGKRGLLNTTSTERDSGFLDRVRCGPHLHLLLAGHGHDKCHCLDRHRPQVCLSEPFERPDHDF